MATLRSNSVAIVASVLSSVLTAFLVLIGWVYVAGGKMKALELRDEQQQAAIIDLRLMLNEHVRDQARVIELLAAIDKRLSELQAEQRILHGRR